MEQELEALDRVLTRLALINDDNKLEQVLDKLLPRLLGSEHLNSSAEVRNKTIAVLQHINKRVRDNVEVKLPCAALLELVQDSKSNPYSINFGLVYLELGCDRLSPGAKSQLVPKLFTGISKMMSSQQQILLRVMVTILPFVSISGDMTQFLDPSTTEDDCNFMLDYFLDWMFLVPSSSSALPPGLTPAKLDRLRNQKKELPSDGNSISNIQLAILKLLLSGAFRNEDVLQHLIVVRGTATRHDVMDYAEHGMTRIMKSIDMEDGALIESLLNLVAPKERKPSSSNVREKALTILLKARDGVRAHSLRGVQVVETCLNSADGSTQLRVLALQFCQAMMEGNRNESNDLDGDYLWTKIMSRQLEQVKHFNGSDTSRMEREQTFTCLAAMMRRFPHLFADKISLGAEMLRLLLVESDIRIVLQESLGALCQAFAQSSNIDVQAVKRMILPYLDSKEPKARLVVAEWCYQLFPFHDCDARYACVVLSNDGNLGTRQVAVKGLTPELCNSNSDGTNIASVATKRERADLKILQDASKLEAGRLGLAWTDSKTYPEEYRVLTTIREQVAYPRFHDWMKSISASSSKLLDTALFKSAALEQHIDAQLQMASVLGFSNFLFLMETQDSDGDSGNSFNQDDIMFFLGLIEKCLEVRDVTQVRGLHRATSKCLVDLVMHGKSLKFSFLDTTWLLKWLQSDSPVVRENMAKLIYYAHDLGHELDSIVDELIVRMGKKVTSAAAARHGAVLASGTLLGEKNDTTTLSRKCQERLGEALVDIVLQPSKMRMVSISSLEAIGMAARSGQFITKRMDQVLEKLDLLCRFEGTSKSGDADLDATNATLIASALTTLSYLYTSSYTNKTDEDRTRILDSILAAGDQNQVELQLVVGKALSTIAASGRDTYGLVMNRVLKEAMVSTKNRVRRSVGFWLLRFVFDFRDESMFEEIHGSFAALLLERSEITRECAARGMALTYACTEDPILRAHLVSSLARHFAGKSTFMSIEKDKLEKEKLEKEKAQNASSIETTPSTNQEDQNDAQQNEEQERQQQRQPEMKINPLNTAYKEMLQVARRVNRPALTYHLLYLSAGDPMWSLSSTLDFRCTSYETDRKLGMNMESDNDEAKTIEDLIPILFRFRFDHDDTIRSTMTKLWETIVDPEDHNEGDIIRAHFTPMIEEVKRNVSSTKFRERNAGAIGLTHIIREVRDEDLIPHLKDLWKLSLRLLDDLNENTKPAALGLAKVMSNTSVRLCDHRHRKRDMREENASYTLDILITFFIEKGLVNPSKDAQALSVHTLARIVKVSDRFIIPFIPIVVSKLLESMSALEDKVLQYAMFHTDDQGGDMGVSRDQLESMRVSASNDSPMQQAVDICIDRIPTTGPEASNAARRVDEVVQELARLARSGVGLPTLAGTVRTISRMIGRRDLSDELKPHAKLLLRSLQGGLTDRSALIRRSFGVTAAEIAQLADSDTVKDFVTFLANLYFNPGDDKARLTVGNAFKELLGRTPDFFLELKEIIVPLAFTARYDSDDDISTIWKQIWSENAGSIQNGVNKNIDLLVPYCIDQMETSTIWLHKHQAIRALQDILVSVEAHRFVPYARKTLIGLVDALPGRLWAGKEALPRTACVAWKKAIMVNAPDIPYAHVDQFCEVVLLPECDRYKVAPTSYTCAVLDAIADVCSTTPEQGKANDPETLVKEIKTRCATLNGARQSKSTLDATIPDEIVSKAYVALAGAWEGSVSKETTENVLEEMQKALQGSTFVIAVGVMSAMKKVLQTLDLSWEVEIHQAIRITWQSIIENKHPQALIAALRALTALFERQQQVSDPQQGKAMAEWKENCKIRVQPLLQHRDPAVVHAASTLENKLNL